MLIKRLPQSDATNVHELLVDVKAAILEEPKRVHMSYVALEQKRNEGRFHKGVPMQWPSCGTVGCFAGWTCMLADYRPDTLSVFNGEHEATKVLGRDLDYHLKSSNGGLFHVFNWGVGDGIDKLTPGTREYARAVVRRINRFIEKNGGKAALSKRPVTRR